jgi:hypothetical protein
MRKLIRYPVTLYAFVGLLMWAVVVGANIQYDEPGLRGAAFFIAEIFGLPFWAIGEVMFTLNGGKAIPGQHVVSIILGLCGCVAIDHFLTRKLLRLRR